MMASGGGGRDSAGSSRYSDRRSADRESRSSAASTTGIIRSNTAWFQRKIHLRPVLRGCHLITDEVLKALPELNEFAVGMAHIQSKCVPLVVA